MSFHVDIGRASLRGQREHNEDFAAALPSPAHEAARGLIAAVADGVSTGGLGRAAAQTAVISLVNDFHAVPATWETTVALDRLIGAHNAWLADHNRRRSDDASGLTTLTALVLGSLVAVSLAPLGLVVVAAVVGERGAAGEGRQGQRGSGRAPMQTGIVSSRGIPRRIAETSSTMPDATSRPNIWIH